MFSVRFRSASFIARQLPRLSLMLLSTLFLGACSISTQLGPIFGTAHDPPATGTITAPDGRFSAEMTDADETQVQSALLAAFAPEAAGRAALWRNEASGRQGSIAAVAEAYTDNDRVCRAFVASLVAGGAARWYQGRACQSGAAPWSIVTSTPWSAPKN